MDSLQPKAMIVNVGGTTAPAIHTLNEQQPPFICFFVSKDSKHKIKKEILSYLKYTPEHYDWIETPVPQDLLECYRVLTKKLPDILEKWGIAPNEVAVEYTGGTKPMSVAVVLATIEQTSNYFYVGSRDPDGRDKNGIGVVIENKESTWFHTNPWVELAVRAKEEIALLFNHGRFIDAQERAEKLAQVVPSDMSSVYKSLAELIKSYALWDRFDYQGAQQKIFRAMNSLKLYLAEREDPLQSSLTVIEKNAEFLRKLTDRNSNEEERLHLDLLDLVANAERRAKVDGKFDDAVARLYAALEGIARNRLWLKYKIKNGNVRIDQIPQSIREEYLQKYADRDNPNNGLKLGLEASYKLLAALEDDIGKKYQVQEKELRKVLYARNQSRLAHGTNPVDEDTYHQLWKIILDFGEIESKELPAFPVLKL
ncbi:MAG: TIGR02710 family CRISPR-associated CARF protein [Anaerolineales bacterium]